MSTAIAVKNTAIAAPACYIRPAMPGDTWLIVAAVRQPDRDELAALGVTPEHCIRHGIKNSSSAFTVFLHGEAAGVFGVVEYESATVPWAVFTTAIDDFPVPFLRASKRYIDSLPMALENCVDARNSQTIAWLRWLGFTIDAPVPTGINGEPFCRFWRCATGSSL